MNPLGKQIRSIANKTFDASVPMEMVFGILIKVDVKKPLWTFRIDQKHDIDEDFIVFPKGTSFSEADIGKKYLFLKNKGGQRYAFLYEVEEE